MELQSGCVAGRTRGWYGVRVRRRLGRLAQCAESAAAANFARNLTVFHFTPINKGLKKKRDKAGFIMTKKAPLASDLPTPHPASKALAYAVMSSAIHGKGVFAVRAIAPGERIIEYRGERIDWDEALRRAEK